MASLYGVCELAVYIMPAYMIRGCRANIIVVASEGVCVLALHCVHFCGLPHIKASWPMAIEHYYRMG